MGMRSDERFFFFLAASIMSFCVTYTLFWHVFPLIEVSFCMQLVSATNLVLVKTWPEGVINIASFFKFLCLTVCFVMRAESAQLRVRALHNHREWKMGKI